MERNERQNFMKTFLDYLCMKESTAEKRLVIYDFDGTLFHSPEEQNGKQMYYDITNKNWPFKGWWGRKETLSPPLVPQNPDSSWYVSNVVESQKSDSQDPNSTVILMTGRAIHLKNRVMEILENAGMHFHDTFFAGQPGTKGGNTFEIKSNNIKNLMNSDYEVLEIWEDRPEHVHEFSKLGLKLKEENPNLKTVIIHDVNRGSKEQF